MKRCITFLLLVLLTLSTFTLGIAEDHSLAYIQERGKLILGFDASFPPMGFQNEDGEYVGYDIDLAKEVAKRLNVELALQPIEWSAKEMELNYKNIDCIWNGMTATPERAESMSLSLNYLNNAQIVCVLADSEIQTLADLSGKTVAVQTDSAGLTALNNNPELLASFKEEPVLYGDYALALLDLDNKGVDAVVLDVIVANYYIATKNANYRVLEEELSPEFYAIGFRKEDKALTEAVNNTLLEMRADGTLETITKEWFSADISIIGK